MSAKLASDGRRDMRHYAEEGETVGQRKSDAMLPHWTVARATVPLFWRGWLLEVASLTAALQRRGVFRLSLLQQRRAVPERDEAVALGLSRQRCVWCREVVLWCDGLPAVYARSLLADESRSAWRLFGRIGTRPLGAALFQDPQIVRGSLQAARLDARHALYVRAMSAYRTALSQAISHGVTLSQTSGGSDRLVSVPPYLWARRSVFWRCGEPLLVQEVFLPPLQYHSPS